MVGDPIPLTPHLYSLPRESYRQVISPPSEGKQKSQKYVKKSICKYRRSLFVQLRVGILPLEIVTWRYRGIAIEERICHFCKSLVEDEVHFLCVCPLYVTERFQLYTSIIERNELLESMEFNTKFQ